VVKRLPMRNEYGFQWMITGAGTYQVCGRTTDILPPGAYTCLFDNCGNPIYQARDLKVDELIEFPGSLPAKVLEEIDLFWSKGDKFSRYGFLHRRGYLFYGKQGCGKSSLIHQVIQGVVSQGYVAFFCEVPHYFTRAVEKFRQVEPERPIVCVFEDIDAIIERYGDSDLLQWLDGNAQVDRAVNLASTNYPEKLDKRIVSRPRRFDRILRIEAPDAAMRERYFAQKVPELSNAELARWVELSDTLPFAALAEMVISVCCLEKTVEEAAELLKSIDAHSPTSLEFANSGVGGAQQDDETDEEDF
jgi:AAA+ superfamily predicted ATPase